MTKITGIWDSLRQLHKSVVWTLACSALIPDNGLSDQCATPLCATPLCATLVTFNMFRLEKKKVSLCCENEIWYLVMFVCVQCDLSSHYSHSSSSLWGSSLTIVCSLFWSCLTCCAPVATSWKHNGSVCFLSGVCHLGLSDTMSAFSCFCSMLRCSEIQANSCFVACEVLK